MDDMRNSTDNDALGCDASFGPSASACHPPRFDFTLFFEQSILTIVPCVLLLLALIPRVVHLSRSRRKVAYTCLIALQLTLLVLWPSHGGRTTSTSIIAASLVLVDGLALAVLSYLEHRRSIRPSSIILAYLILSIAFDATQCRTLWLLAESSVAPVFTSALACKLLLFFLELAEKRYILLPPWKALSPETTSSIISKGFFWWLNSLLLRGFRATLSTDSIYDIDDALKSKGLLDKLLGARQRWEMSRRFHRYRLLLATCDSIRRPLATTALPRLCLIGFKFAQPFLIKSVVSHVDGVHVHDRFRMEAAYALVAATAFVFLGKAISHGFYQHQLFRTLTMIRGALVSLIFLQTLNLSVVSSDTQNVAALTHVGPDVMSISKAFESVHEIWANPIEIGLAIWLLSRELGPGCVGPAVAVITCTAAMTKLSKYMGPAMKVWNEAIQRRISATSNVMGFMREVKMLGMVPLWTTTIQSLRVAELQCSKRFRIFIAYLNVLGNAPSALAPLISFGVAIALAGKSSQQSLSISAAFTSLSIISLIAEPLAHLLASVPSFVSSFGSFDRIEAFLQQGQTALSTSLACQHDQHESSNDKDPILAANLELVPILNQQCDTFKVEKASFLLRQGCMPILKDLTFTIRPSTLTIVTGKVGRLHEHYTQESE
ncbi:hypothetical protein RJ55_03843 [Drechmeria coniospora]|nr:hypothetical protein RJ55_03843 [Drechmeria coniospora]